MNALWVMECDSHKRMMEMIDDDVGNLYAEFQINSMILYNHELQVRKMRTCSGLKQLLDGGDCFSISDFVI